MWLGTELGEGFRNLSEMRSVKEMDIETGLTVIQLFDRLAAHYPLVGKKIFNQEKKKFQPNLSIIVTQDNRVVSPFNLEESILQDGYKVTVLPLYVGG